MQETVREVGQNFSTNLGKIADEKTNHKKLLKTLVCLERRS